MLRRVSVAEVSIAVESRSGTGKSYNRKLRAQGKVPGVVYGSGKEPVSVSFDPKVLEGKLSESHAGINTLFDLEGDSSVANRVVMVKELQREPVRGAVLHADFYEIDLTERLHVSVPVHLSGTAPGLIEGGVIEHALRELELACLPNAIPDEVIADVSGLELGQSLHVADIQLPGGVELVSNSELSVVSVLLPKIIEEEVVEPEEGEEGVAGEGEADSEGTAEGDSEAEDKGD
ncbi:MAG TPA: 50S ribosomal protein L25 [Myxococcales bacterium]|nr:50S ribosomal protein L25 [Myxococcales bacterium]HIL81579.1 50S ribosomal protein L25 [Myxococcales bacterium]